jgi:hypothetical protein
VGVLSHAGLSGEDALEIAECLRRGATLVAARVPEADRSQYEAILAHGAINVQVRVAAYRRAGWKAYDPNAAPLTAEEMQRERKP